MNKIKMYINGEFIEASDKGFIESINPSNGQVIAAFSRATLEDTKEAINAAKQAFEKGPWKDMTFRQRGSFLLCIGELIREKAFELASLETQDTGKTIKQTTFIDIPTAASAFEYFGKNPHQIKGREIKIPFPAESLIDYEPVGVVAQIIPWNYPLLMAAWKISQALIMGNTIVFKPSRYASLSCIELAKIIHESKLPKGVFNLVTGEGNIVGRELASNKDVRMISFTGSNAVGKEIMKLASNNIKRTVLELGGKGANIVFKDADLDAALGGTLSAIFMNQGQMCTAGSRLLLQDKIYDEFLSRLIDKTKRLRIGDASNHETDFGPLISQDQRKKVLEYNDIAKAEGGRLLCGGKIPEEIEEGFFFEPTIFDNVDNNMRIVQEEIFGPLLAVLKFSTLDEAVAIANDTRFGLANMVWAKDLEKAKVVARKLESGTVWINNYGGFYNEVPFGGYKESGIGRELGKEGLLEYTQVKHINTDKTPSGKPLVSNWFAV